ncbi:methyl-accepting chemotaxis protein [Marinomonas fungiae]|uniref:Methyl-accepting chemotaxis sensory transducer with Cache sensor n=1 Tax=Marinomonas fungiae TaxID=1137284 RepID=A0A0K6IMY8_9GAMM|nr:methyl-accepting chemotaxis protein [Marinomonas fungiae]CUB04468.1 methyl-accepting chemotaxis sensory transducer with Cache sensor [Marinomonas fungiae]
MKPVLMIRQKILLGLIAIFVLAIAVVFMVVEGKVKSDLITERQAQIDVNQQGLVSLLEAKLDQVQLLTSTLALSATELPEDEALYKKVLPRLIDNHGDKSIAGGGIWPEPGAFKAGVDRHSFFWARSGSGLEFLNDYNDPSGSGYHNEGWYTVGRNASIERCSWSEAYTDPVSKVPMVTCTVPIKEQGRFAGVATVDMMLDGITKSLSLYGEENHGYVFALDAQGQMLSFPANTAKIVKADNSMVTAKELATQLPWLAPALNAALNKETGVMLAITQDSILGQAAFVDLVTVPSTGWTIGLVVPKAVMTNVANSMSVFLMLSLGALLIVVSIVAYLFFRGLLARVNQTTEQINSLVSGNTSQELAILKQDEIGQLRQSVNDYGGKLKSLLASIHQESAKLVGDASKLKDFSNEFLSKANSLSDENHTLAAATEEFGATSADVAMYSNETKATVERIHEEVRTSGKEMKGVIDTMRTLSKTMGRAQQNILKLDEDSRQAHSMLSVIRDIAEQTNLLALNAAIEAARAGETGRGFAVVADEVRNLAAKSESSAVEIERVLNRLQDASKESVASMSTGMSETESAVGNAESTANHLQDVVSAFSQITDQATQISVAANEQQKVSSDLTEFVSRLQALTSSNADDSGRLSKMSEEIDAIAKRLNALK